MVSDKGGTLQQVLTHPTGTLISVAGRVPGASAVRGAANGVLDLVGAVSPWSRRIVEQARAGAREVPGVLDWPFARVGAAVEGLRQVGHAPEPEHEPEATPTPLDVAHAVQAHRQDHVPQPEQQAPAEPPFEELDTPSDRLP